MKTIALIDTAWTGHHPTYFKLFTKTLLELGHQVMAFCPEPDQLREQISQNCPILSERLHAFKICEPQLSQFPIPKLRATLTTLARWRSASASLSKAIATVGTSPDLVFFCWIDHYLGAYLLKYWVDKVFPYQWSGLYFHPTYLRLEQERIPKNSALKSSSCSTVAILDEGVTEKLKDVMGGKPVITFPDFTDESSPDLDFPVVGEIQRKANGRTIVSLLGSLQKRKGFLTLLEIAQRSTERDWFFVFAGYLNENTFSPQELARIQDFVETTPSNCLFHFERIPDEPQFNALVDVCDILWVVYDNFPHSSNMLAKAAVFQKPVLASNTFCIGERVRQFQLGLGIDEGDVDQGIKALAQLCGLSHKGSSSELQFGFESYKCLHSTKQLKIAFKAVLDLI
ncbi:glycosyltransferase family 1 protein [Leptolyngbya sp. FACHB-261]|uniref:glycosyltransferase family 1 protein n=1 Tax=Leptolyngbya sp. FACHB-261 TaxID=2692806 RepID=UPI0016848371|nr:glycosyltransferase family 1 protein [Leptolyngbya sp. FACHB-261]MBD2101741.1 glycosyltransferase family 1 protein [Leptolyngbya sp. FACHB-261]